LQLKRSRKTDEEKLEAQKKAQEARLKVREEKVLEKQRAAEDKQRLKEEKKKKCELLRQLKPGECMKVGTPFTSSYFDTESNRKLFVAHFCIYRLKFVELQIWWRTHYSCTTGGH